MKLNKGDRVRYDGSMYEVVAVVLTTVYLRESDCGTDSGDCFDMQDVYEKYRDIEILESEEKYG